jgi:hypothetical protein
MWGKRLDPQRPPRARRRARSPERPAGGAVEVSLKVAGIHWYFRSRSHAAELTAGYYNADGRDGYNAAVEMCARHGAALTLTCVEMCDAQHPPHALCGPEGLLRQARRPRPDAPAALRAVHCCTVHWRRGVAKGSRPACRQCARDFRRHTGAVPGLAPFAWGCGHTAAWKAGEPGLHPWEWWACVALQAALLDPFCKTQAVLGFRARA